MESGSPVDLRQNQPHTARMYDYYLGGQDHYSADAEAAEKVVATWPGVRVAAQQNRAFIHRVTRFLANAGIRQFLDIGTGIPTEPNLHQVAQQVAPEARVVYVDNDPIVLVHARALMISSPEGRTNYISADVTTPEAILDAPGLHETLDLTRPVAVSLNALMHFVPDGQDAYGIIETLMKRFVPGSYLVMTHVTPDFDPTAIATVVDIYRRSGLPCQVRSRDQFARFFDGMELIEPGVEVPHRWRPDGVAPPKKMDAQVSAYAAVARK
ncbi:SAM-dependent methyltransferase [Nocardia africana]|uniref:S-adenosyl methyltransferase n=1 Tax=Nocardia africana TaxID=134964 RepID=A0A378X0Q5_9NOCA|nr:SAM-dependent methyltransferase [Nocardia africana]MCC3312430.1 SAM-dependent methyltransferase [Nocardia africana]SUA46254.1 S-adenosyl methyltransferase [Nocardia africana]